MAIRIRPLVADKRGDNPHYYAVKGFPQDRASAEKLAKEKPFEFEQWIVEHVLHGHSTRKTADGGYDGHIAYTHGTAKRIALVEVKGGNCTVKNIREFDNVIQQQKANNGIFVCFKKQVTSEMKKHCNAQGYAEEEEEEEEKQVRLSSEIPKIAILTVEDILDNIMPHWLTFYISNVTY